uniref:Uncharacterized protein n=1 Tax=Anopheles dirus TaxID=7168 RepID=A0A182NAZ4_9DIPT
MIFYYVAASATGSPTASLHSCTKLVRCSRAAPTDEPDTASVELERERHRPAPPSERPAPCHQQPKLAIAQLASLASISTTATFTQQVITTTTTTTVVGNDISQQHIAAAESSASTTAQQPSQQPGCSVTAAAPKETPDSERASGSTQQQQRHHHSETGSRSPTPSTSSTVAAPRRICTLKVKIFLIKHLSKLVACNKKMFLPVKSNT